MDPLSVLDFYFSAITAVTLTIQAIGLVKRELDRAIDLGKLYGLNGLILIFFGNRTTWRLEADILGGMKVEDAVAFKQLVQDQSTTVGVAVSSFFQA